MTVNVFLRRWTVGLLLNFDTPGGIGVLFRCWGCHWEISNRINSSTVVPPLICGILVQGLWPFIIVLSCPFRQGCPTHTPPLPPSRPFLTPTVVGHVPFHSCKMHHNQGLEEALSRDCRGDEHCYYPHDSADYDQHSPCLLLSKSVEPVVVLCSPHSVPIQPGYSRLL